MINNKIYKTKTYDIEIIDRIGAGDSFAAGMINGFLTHNDPQKTLDIAVAFSAIKQTIPGDVAYTDLAEAQRVFKSDSLRIVR